MKLEPKEMTKAGSYYTFQTKETNQSGIDRTKKIQVWEL